MSASGKTSSTAITITLGGVVPQHRREQRALLLA